MVLLPYPDILEICFDSENFKSNKKLFDIIYNTESVVCLTRNYIEILENQTSNIDAFRALISELFDNDRIKIEQTNSKKNLDEEFIEIALNAQIPLLMPICSKPFKPQIIERIPFLTIVEDAKPKNKHWIALELLSKNFCNVSFIDFKNDNEILDFIRNIFSLPKYIRKVIIFDRQQNTNLLTPIKGNNINFYTICNGGFKNEFERKSIKSELRKRLGGKLKLFYTTNKRLIHERKIIFEDIIITLDNSLENITIGEPTWEIFISYNKEKASNWIEKQNKFVEII